jgi:hypothetical protein
MCTQVLWCLARLARSRASGVNIDPDIRLTILSTRATQCMRLEDFRFLRFSLSYTDTHLYVFSLALALPVIINQHNLQT